MKCRGCGKEVLFFITKNKKMIPVDADSISEMDKHHFITTPNLDKNPLPFRYGEHRPHFLTCPNADKFRKKKNENSTQQEEPRPSTDYSLFG